MALTIYDFDSPVSNSYLTANQAWPDFDRKFLAFALITSTDFFDYINGFLWLDQGISRRQKGEQEGKWKTRSRPPTQRRAWGCDRLNHQVLLLFTLLLWTAGKTMRFRCNSKSMIITKMSLRNDILRSIECIPSGVLMLVLTLASMGCNHQVIIEEHG